jgi:hypothetical protein
MKGYNLSHSVLVQALDGDLSAGTDGSRVTSLPEVDAKDCESVLFCIQLATVTSTGSIRAWVKGSNTSGTYGSGTVGDLGTVVKVDWSNKVVYIEVRRPLHRFLRLDYQRTIANVVVTNIVAIKNLNREVLATEAFGTVLNQPEAATA